MEKNGLRRMIADYMENGFLENIAAMFRQDPSLYEFLGDLLADERVKVRLGAMALMEELKEERPSDVKLAIPNLVPLLRNGNPTVRGDAASMLALIGGRDVCEEIRPLLDDPEPQVAMLARELLEELGG